MTLVQHGSRRTIEVFNSDVSPETFAYILRNRKDYHGQPIRLFSCRAGEVDENGDCFARKLADILGVEVHAAPSNTVIKSNGEFYFRETGDSEFIPFQAREV